MEGMSQERDEARALIERLPDEKLASACRLLRYIIEEQGSNEVDLADEMDEAELVEFDASLERSLTDIEAGRFRPASEILEKL